MSSSSSTPSPLVREAPTYEQHPHVEMFENEIAFNDWFENNCSKHAVWVVTKKTKNVSNEDVLYYGCDHSSKPQKKNYKTPEEKKRQTKASIKVGCPAKLNVVKRNEGSFFVKYYWKHEKHDPNATSDIVDSRVSDEIRAWIEEHVDKHMDWKSIKALLRLNAEDLDRVNTNII